MVDGPPFGLRPLREQLRRDALQRLLHPEWELRLSELFEPWKLRGRRLLGPLQQQPW